jgi:hypothetical protein
MEVQLYVQGSKESDLTWHISYVQIVTPILFWWHKIEQTDNRFYLINLTPVKPSGHYIYRQFNIQQFYVLPTHCIYVFCVDLRTNSDYFLTQH